MEPDPALAAVKTYNYLRIALAALVLLLYTSVVLEWWAAGRCLQTSISAYYYTPVHAVFIGVLVTMGVCLVALKGNTDGEDVLMNLAGMLAPGVAFIPTVGCRRSAARRRCSRRTSRPPSPTTCRRCSSPVASSALVALVDRAPRGRGGPGSAPPTGCGLALSLGVLGGGIVWFFVARDSFIAHGHDAAAIPMFLAIVGVVWLNARDVQQAVQQEAVPTTRSRYVAMYRASPSRCWSPWSPTVGHQPRDRSTTVVFWVEVVLHQPVRGVLGHPDRRAVEPRPAPDLTAARHGIRPVRGPIVGAWPATSTCTRSTRSPGPSPRRWRCCVRAG